MTREEAIERFENVKANALVQKASGVSEYWQNEIDGTIEAIDMAIEALTEETIEIKPIEIKGDFRIDDCIYCSPKIVGNVEVVVRCKDCKNWRESHSEDEESYCYIDGRTVDSTDYCSWGERIEK